MRWDEWKGNWSEKDCRLNPGFLFIYGDNEEHDGKGGQAIIRDELNAFGIPTKKDSGHFEDSYYSDDELYQNRKAILDAISIIVDEIKTFRYTKVIFPKNGLGTGLAMLDKKAPKTFKILNQEIEYLKEFIDNIEIPTTSELINIIPDLNKLNRGQIVDILMCLKNSGSLNNGFL